MPLRSLKHDHTAKQGCIYQMGNEVRVCVRRAGSGPQQDPESDVASPLVTRSRLH